MKESIVPDTIKGFLQFEKYRSCVYVVIKDLAKLLGKFGQLY